MSWQRWVCGYLLSLCLVGGVVTYFGCAARVASPDLGPNAELRNSIDAMVALLGNQGDAEVEGQGDASTGGAVGKIGGGGDSVALWLAIVMMGLGAYPGGRAVRRGLASWRGKFGK